jgi:hypothetical protein
MSYRHIFCQIVFVTKNSKHTLNEDYSGGIFVPHNDYYFLLTIVMLYKCAIATEAG